MSLIPCPECNRHVRRGEQDCPFCGASVASAFAATPERALPTTRLGRGAIFAFAATVGVAACGGESSGGNGGNVVPVYGAPFDAGLLADANVGSGGGGGQGGLVAAYGAPPAGGTAGVGGIPPGMGGAAYGTPPWLTGGAGGTLPGAGGAADSGTFGNAAGGDPGAGGAIYGVPPNP